MRQAFWGHTVTHLDPMGLLHKYVRHRFGVIMGLHVAPDRSLFKFVSLPACLSGSVFPSHKPTFAGKPCLQTFSHEREPR